MGSAVRFTAHEIDPQGTREITRQLPNLGIVVETLNFRGFVVRFDSGLFPVIVSSERIVSSTPLEAVKMAGILALEEYVPVEQVHNVYEPYKEFMDAVVTALQVTDNAWDLLKVVREVPDKLPQIFLESRKIKSPRDLSEYRRTSSYLAMSLNDAMVELLESDDRTFRLTRVHQALRLVFRRIPRQARYGEGQIIA